MRVNNLADCGFLDFVIRWNNLFPIDIWWRKKYNIAFNSEVHRNTSFIDMLFEFVEDKAMNDFSKKRTLLKEEQEDYFITGRWVRRGAKISSQEEIDDWFNNFNVSQYNKNQPQKEEK